MKNPDKQLDLLTPAQFVKGVGPNRAELLEKMGIRTAQDIVFCFPRNYRDLTKLSSIRELEQNVTTRILGVIQEIEQRDLGNGRSMVGALVKQDNEYVRAVWFNQPFILKQLRKEQQVILTGEPKLRGFRWEMPHPRVENITDELPEGGLQPIYPLTQGLSQTQMRKLVQQTVQMYANELIEVFPDRLLEDYELLPINQALQLMHAPQSPEDLQQARFRFAYQELFTMQLALALRYSNVTAAPCSALPCDGKIDARIRRLLPFEMTNGQYKVSKEICEDMARDRPMNRMLHGDVGSGKTVVALYAMLVAIANKHQATMMAPTEILARQHHQNLSHLLSKSKVRVGLLTGSLTASERRTMLREIEAGEIDLVIGTQAVVQEKVKFHRLGLAVIDEGHRFGVQQRARLRQGTQEPHYLLMTATPIPRTVAMTLFGDLDVSKLTELPSGRQPIHTYVGDESKRSDWWAFNRKKLREGQQAYVIAPLVDEKADGEIVSSAEQLFEQLCSEELDEFRVGLLHGRMSSEEKKDTMQRFRRGNIQCLVATTLVEVGVDVPNANLMTIENAERFGLAQLHQLRGRVGRGKYPGFVCAYSPSDTPEARQRLDAFARTTNGFELAEIDFQLRGPGELFGTRQHGLPKLRVASLQEDMEILEIARHNAKALLEADPKLKADDLSLLRDRVQRRYGDRLQLGDVG